MGIFRGQWAGTGRGELIADLTQRMETTSSPFFGGGMSAPEAPGHPYRFCALRGREEADRGEWASPDPVDTSRVSCDLVRSVPCFLRPEL